jgi:hypothetical protein
MARAAHSLLDSVIAHLYAAIAYRPRMELDLLRPLTLSDFYRTAEYVQTS